MQARDDEDVRQSSTSQVCNCARPNPKNAIRHKATYAVLSPDRVWPAGKLVLFCYNSFDAALVGKLVASLERGLAGPIEHVFVVYYNPVWGALLDRSPAFERWYAATLPYDSSELGFGPDRSDAIVIWQSARNAYPRRHVERASRIQTDALGRHAALVS